MNQLAYELSQELKRLRAVNESEPPMPEGPGVFLAEVTDDLEAQREAVQRYLSQAGMNVWPQTCYPHDVPAAFDVPIVAH